MARSTHPSSHARSPGRAASIEPDHPTDDDRSFAELRKTINNAIGILLLHRWAFFVPFCVAGSGVFIASLYYPRTYSATTTFERQDHAVMLDLPRFEGMGSFAYFRSTLVQDIVSPEHVAEVVEALGLTKDFERNPDGTLTRASIRRRDGLARSLAGCLSVATRSPNKHIDHVTIKYVGPDAAIGKRFVDAVRRTYIERTTARIRESLMERRTYTATQWGKAFAQFKEAQRRETLLRMQNPAIDPRDFGAITGKLAQLESEHRGLRLRRRLLEADLAAAKQIIAAAQPRIAARRARVAARPATGIDLVDDPALAGLIREIKRLDGEIETMRTARLMTDEHPELKRLLDTRIRLHAMLDAKRVDVADVVVEAADSQSAAVESAVEGDALLQQWDAEHAAAYVRIAAIEAQINDIKLEMDANQRGIQQLEAAKKSVFEKQEEYAAVAADRAAATQALATHSATLTKLDPVIEALNEGIGVQFFAEQPATGGTKPISPRTQSTIMLALMAGVALGALFVIAAELFDHIYRSAGQVARGLGVPILEAIDEIITPTDRRRNLIRRVVAAPVAVACGIAILALTGSLAYLSIERPWTYERMRNIPKATIGFFADTTPDDADTRGTNS